MRALSFCVVFLLALVLSSVLPLGLKVQVAEAGGTVYIRADGSVDPPTVPIQRTQDTYTFYGDVNASLVLQRDNIVVDGAGHLLKGEGGGTGVDLTGRVNVRVKNLGITAFQNGVYLSFSYNNTLSGNNMTANTDYGIQSDFWNGCSGTVIINNSITGNGGTGNGGGILINPASSYISIIDNYVAENNLDGIRLYATAHDLLSGNRVTANNGFGIYLDSWNTTLRNNSMNQNRYNFGIEAYFLDVFVSNDVDVSNTVDGRPVYYWMNKHGVTVPSDAGYVALINSSDVTVKGLNLTNNGQGVVLFNTENCTVTENNMANNWKGFWIDGDYGTALSRNNSITYNNMTHNDDFVVENSALTIVSYNNIEDSSDEAAGISFSSASDNRICYNNMTRVGIDLSGCPNTVISYNNMVQTGITDYGSANLTVSYNNVSGGGIYTGSSGNAITHNRVEAGDWGLYLDGASNNDVSYNTITNNFDGLFLIYSANGNNVSNNNVTGNSYAVELVFDSSNNVFCHNSFVNNTHLLRSSFGGANVWDSGYPSGGNYWSSYGDADVHSGPLQNETGSDGIGDTAYVIDPNNIDRYPLMKPYAGPHDLGVKASVSKTVVPENYGRPITLNGTIINYGVQSATFNLTFQTGATVQTKELTLKMRNSTDFAFSLNTTGWAKGNYMLRVRASPVPGEADTTDNAYDGLLTVTILGDINGDARVDMKDVGYVARRFGIDSTSQLWNSNADLNDDLKMDMRDIGAVARHFGESWQ